MKKVFLALSVFILLVPFAAAAEREPTEEEKARVRAALAAVNCEDGRIRVKDYGFKVVGASCDGKDSWEIRLGQSFEVLSRKRDD
ncbi:hypothetical protein [Microbulbifer yueqingensis]|uniref:PepSY domain-containing protein n=1 Tax=Microbulbifer yueqingensis TaxID=658219 RepID=A0A1G8Y752_9GAMM|nr:hypothetical protein [Microbulbifer yueqingensis]SDJ98658.1 hypothetical protein SAMN05216212_1385 [Microbulbifer yueqingensis]